MDIRRHRTPQPIHQVSKRQVPMHFQFKKIPKTIVQQTKTFVQSSKIVPSLIFVPSSEPVTAPTNIEEIVFIEQQVKLHQQIVAEWDSKMELIRTQEIQMRRTDVVRELDTLIKIWNNANPQ